MTMTTPIRGYIVCHPKASTWSWYIPPANKIRRRSLQPFRRYDCGRRN